MHINIAPNSPSQEMKTPVAMQVPNDKGIETPAPQRKNNNSNSQTPI